MQNSILLLHNTKNTIDYFLKYGWNWKKSQKIGINLYRRAMMIEESDFSYVLYCNEPRYVLLFNEFKNDGSTEMCLFCGSEHIHGRDEGHRLPHCNDRGIGFIAEFEHKDGTIVNHKNGYVLRYRK